jgi:hypothetical protein
MPGDIIETDKIPSRLNEAYFKVVEELEEKEEKKVKKSSDFATSGCSKEVK